MSSNLLTNSLFTRAEMWQGPLACALMPFLHPGSLPRVGDAPLPKAGGRRVPPGHMSVGSNIKAGPCDASCSSPPLPWPPAAGTRPANDVLRSLVGVREPTDPAVSARRTTPSA